MKQEGCPAPAEGPGGDTPRAARPEGAAGGAAASARPPEDGGRAAEPLLSDARRTAAILARYPGRDPGELVNVLHDVQAEFRYLPEEALRQVAQHLRLPRAQVYGVVTFYHGFHTEPRGAHTCTVCVGTACHVRGASRLLEQVERDTGVAAGETADDLSLSVEEVGCVGACALGPLVLLDGEHHGHMTGERLSRLVRRMVEAKEQE